MGYGSKTLSMAMTHLFLKGDAKGCCFEIFLYLYFFFIFFNSFHLFVFVAYLLLLCSGNDVNFVSPVWYPAYYDVVKGEGSPDKADLLKYNQSR